MAAEVKKEIELEIAHVLFIDIVVYSKMAIDDQRAAIEELNQIVQSTDEFLKAESESRLLKIPTGDGMALVFYRSPEAPVECALEISRALKEHPRLKLRMGVHSGPVSGVVDVNGRLNVAGEGINMAQRVMDCGDAGHILLSKRVADDLHQFSHWRPHLYDLGEREVKHGEKISVVNLFTAELGNRELPEKFKSAPVAAAIPAKTFDSNPRQIRWGVLIAPALLLMAALVAGVLIFSQRSGPRQSISTATPGPSTTAVPAIPEKSIAVLPFENFSADKENAFFADGVQDDILTALAKVADLKVISRTSVMSYAAGTKRNLREIGQALGVAHVLEGSVRRAGDKVRVTAQLVDTRTDGHLWADTYDRNLADVFAIQSEIAQQIANQLQAKLSPNEKSSIEERPTKDITAYDLYVRAKALDATRVIFNARAKDNLLEESRLLDQAITRDPDFFLAYCLLASVHGNLYFFGFDHTAERAALADRAVQNALRLRPDAGEAHFARAGYLYRCYLDYDHARSELALAQRTLPNSADVFALMGYIDRRQSRWNESIRNLEKALQIDPRNRSILQQAALTYQRLRRYVESAAAVDRALILAPTDVGLRVQRGAVALEWRADPKPLHDTIETIVAENPAAGSDIADRWLYLALCERDPAGLADALAHIPANGIGIDLPNFPVSWWQGVVARSRGDEAAAQKALSMTRTDVERTVREQPDYGAAFCLLGLIDAGLGRKEEAIREGRRAVELLPATKDSVNGSNMMKYLAVIYAWTGEKDLALQQIEATLKIPADLSYGQLKLHPFWDPLRGDPRFEKIVAGLAPK
ncbi:MAG: hypothetical protein QOH24_1686 [Verrucomicrobiota bacterium]